MESLGAEENDDNDTQSNTSSTEELHEPEPTPDITADAPVAAVHVPEPLCEPTPVKSEAVAESYPVEPPQAHVKFELPDVPVMKKKKKKKTKTPAAYKPPFPPRHRLFI